jgi:hypothetical protein
MGAAVETTVPRGTRSATPVAPAARWGGIEGCRRWCMNRLVAALRAAPARLRTRGDFHPCKWPAGSWENWSKIGVRGWELQRAAWCRGQGKQGWDAALTNCRWQPRVRLRKPSRKREGSLKARGNPEEGAGGPRRFSALTVFGLVRGSDFSRSIFFFRDVVKIEFRPDGCQNERNWNAARCVSAISRAGGRRGLRCGRAAPR